MIVRLLLCLSVCLLAVHAACPNACSGNGVCVADVCTCLDGFAGDDCSISDKEITIGETLTDQSVPTRQWRYFHVDINPMGSVYVEISQTSDGGDIDSYLRLGSRPSKTLYDERDITTNRDVELVLKDAEGTLYIGLYGYISATASITVTVHTQCLNDCSEAGECSSQGYCECYEGHAGDDCSIDIVTLTNNSTVTGVVQRGEWQYFDAEYLSTQHDSLLFVVRQANPYPENDCNLYIQFGWLPMLNFYQWRDVSTSNEYRVSVDGVQEGHYYAGVYGNNVCEFNITVYLQEPSCPNMCSGPSHGECDEITFECNCDSNFAGDSCNTMIPTLGFNIPVEGYVSGNAWNYYTLNTFSVANTLVTVQQSQDDGADCDLYVAQGRQPNFIDYDFCELTYSEEFSVLISGGGVSASWTAGVHGYSACNYTLTASLVLSCPNDCTDENHGTCIDGVCRCNNGFSGEDCSSSLATLENGGDIVDTVTSGGWKYYLFNVAKDTRATVYLRESLSTGFVWLYANPLHANNPTLLNHEFDDTETGTGVHIISIDASQPTAYVIGVHGNALSVPGSELEFSLVAYQPFA